MAIYEKITQTQDFLLAGPEIPALTKNFEINAGTAIKRGTLLTVKEGKAAATAKGEIATAVVAYDADDKATVVTAYTTGRFYRKGLHATEGDTVEAHEEELRSVGIHVAGLI